MSDSDRSAVTSPRRDLLPAPGSSVVRQRLGALLAFWIGFVAAPAAWLLLGPGPQALAAGWRSLVLPVVVGVALGSVFAFAIRAQVNRVRLLAGSTHPALRRLLPTDIRQRIDALLGWRIPVVFGGQMALGGLGIGLALVVGETEGVTGPLLAAVLTGAATAAAAHRVTKPA